MDVNMRNNDNFLPIIFEIHPILGTKTNYHVNLLKSTHSFGDDTYSLHVYTDGEAQKPVNSSCDVCAFALVSFALGSGRSHVSIQQNI